MINDWGILIEIALRWMLLDLTDDKSTLVQVIAWCLQVTIHDLSQCWPCSMLPSGVTRPQRVKLSISDVDRHFNFDSYQNIRIDCSYHESEPYDYIYIFNSNLLTPQQTQWGRLLLMPFGIVNLSLQISSLLPDGNKPMAEPILTYH